jgi:membrane protease YdiL (CAAX protease family)
MLISKIKIINDRNYKFPKEDENDDYEIYLEKKKKFDEIEFYYLFLSTLFVMFFFLIVTIIFELIPYNHLTKNLENIIKYDKFFYDLIKVLFLFSSLYFGFIVQLILKFEKINEQNGIILFIKAVIYGPFMEEVIYRFLIYELLLNGGFSAIKSSLISSSLFGISNKK